jgi:discoidin domain receptor family protein 2
MRCKIASVLVAIVGGLLSYSMPQGSKRGENWNFYDHTYDGVWEDNYLRNGLGQLTDGRSGPNNFKDDYYGHERGESTF